MKCVVFAVVLAGCLDPLSVVCDDPHGTICAGGTVCARITALGDEGSQCVNPSAFGACDERDAGAACVVDGVEGTCFATPDRPVCVPQTCGDGLRDLVEQCDDANEASADGCSADCLSDETCGNGAIDGVAFEQCDDGNLLDHDGCSSTCRPEIATWTSLEINRVPDQRVDSASAFDTSRGEAVMFGGGEDGNGDFTDETWLWSGLGWRLATPTARPPGRGAHVMAYDAKRGRVVLFGGMSAAGVFADTWEWDGLTWTRRATPTSPPERENAMMAYDSQRERVVLFGGRVVPVGIGVPHYYDDTWEWDGTTWTEIDTPHRPVRRAEAAMAYDPARGRMVMFGGRGGASPFSILPPAVWEYDGTDWRDVAPAPTPNARTNLAMAWDSNLGRVVMFGGYGMTTGISPREESLGDFWSWNGVVWTRLLPSGDTPSVRDGHTMVFDPSRQRVITSGGVEAGTIDQEFTSWAWDGIAWTRVGDVDLRFDRDACSALDLARGRAVVVDAGTNTFETDGRSWNDPRVRFGVRCSGLVYDITAKRVVMFASDVAERVAATVAWDGSTWIDVATTAQPLPRSRVMMAYDASRQYTILFGGHGEAQAALETWILDANGWRMATPAHVPPGRAGHVLAYDPERREVVLFGGVTGSLDELGDTWVWNGDDWVERQPMHSPAARSDSHFAWNPARRRLVLFAGLDGSTTFDDTWEWTGTDWELVESQVSPPGRSAGTMFTAPDGSGVIVVDGQAASLNARTDDRWLLRWQGTRPGEACIDARADQDGDGKRGCDDRDCWATCTPLCPPVPGDAPSCTAAPRCGDQACSPDLESCASCPEDCGECEPVCGNAEAETGETPSTCAGDA